MRSAFWIGSVVLFLGGCGSHVSPPSPSRSAVVPAAELQRFGIGEEEIYDLVCYEQSILPYAERNAKNHEVLFEVQKTFESKYYLPWSHLSPPISAQEAAWPFRVHTKGYGSNLRPVPPEWFGEIERNAFFETFGTLNQKGIALRWMDLRSFPTSKPLYNDPKLPGEGYPFDQLQNSSVNYNEPLFISHTSKDGAWSYVFTNNASGWVPADGVAVVDEEMIPALMGGEKVFLLEDDLPLREPSGRFATYSRIGMVLPLQQERSDGYDVLVCNAQNSYTTLTIPKSSARIGVSPLNRNDLIRLGGEMLKNTYGWGGMYGERDCSSMIRDMYTPFGIWMPRNSAGQARRGEVISFEGLSENDKLKLIEARGVPFETIVYLKGHVMLYIGTYENRVMVMHNVWGVRTIDRWGQKGRRIVGKAVISTLEMGAELEEFDPENGLLRRARSMNIFTREPSLAAKGKKGFSKKKKPVLLSADRR